MSTAMQQQPNLNLPKPVEAPTPEAPAPMGISELQGPAVPPSPSAVEPPTAREGEVLDARWITAVENLMKQGIDDPALLAEQLIELKAQYIAGRFGKEIKRASVKGGQ